MLNAQILEIENALVSLDMSNHAEAEAVLKSSVYQEILERYEDLFEETIYRKED